MLRNDRHSWGAVARFLHWGMAALIFAQFALGWTALTWRLSPTKLQLFIWHKSFGILLLVLVLLRLAWRLANTTPALPPGLPHWEHNAARASHLLLYFLMIAMPVTGWIINSAANIPFRVFWLFPLPDITEPDKALEELAKRAHLALFVLLATVVAVHIAAALRHHFVRRNDVLIRMLAGKGTRK
jgi:cytochrome b561